MAEFTKPNLPDPGPNRWWEIRLDGDRWELRLYTDEPENGRYNGYHRVLATDDLHDNSATADEFEYVAQAILTRLAREAAFIGTYHKN